MWLSRRLCRSLSLMHFHNSDRWPAKLKETVTGCCTIIADFLSEAEENSLLDEINPHMKRMRYEKSHWDDAIHLYREREQLRWSAENEAIFERIRNSSFHTDHPRNLFVHVLDLHQDGVIKAHLDSVRYCGDVISGVSLLSDAVLRLRHKDRKDELILDVLAKRRSLYRMGEISRYDFYHEVLGKDESYFMGERVERKRRISVILRELPCNTIDEDPNNETKYGRQLMENEGEAHS